MPGMYLSMEMSQRLQLAQRLELRQELRLQLSQRLILSIQDKMNIEGVEDPMRVRYCEIPTAKGEKIPMAAKIICEDEESEFGYIEAGNQLTMQEKGFNVPEVAGVMSAEGRTIIFTEFVKNSANIGTLLSKDDVLKKYVQKYAYSKRELADLEEADQNIAIQNKMSEVAHAFGSEIARMHRAGVLKGDISPRNLLLTFDSQGKPKIWHTGFSNIEFKTTLSPEEQKKNLKNMAEAFADFTNDKALEKAFLSGYHGMEWSARTAIELAMQEEEMQDDEVKGSAKNTNAADIREQVKSRLMRLFGGKGYVAASESEEDKENQQSPNLSEHIEQYILTCPLSKLVIDGYYTERSHQVAFVKSVEMVIQTLQPNEGMAYQESRAIRVANYLYSCLISGQGDAKLDDIVDCPDDELRMDSSQASRLTAPLIEKFKIPQLGNFKSHIDKSIVLRFKKEHLDLSDQAISDLLENQLNIRLARRTITKYSNDLKEAGKLPKLDNKLQRRAKAHFANVIASEGVINVEDFVEVLKTEKEVLTDYLNGLVLEYLDEQIKKALAANTIDALNIVDLAMRLNLEMTFIIERIEKIKNKLSMSATVIPAENPEEVVEETADKIGDVLAQDNNQPEGDEEPDDQIENEQKIELQPEIESQSEPVNQIQPPLQPPREVAPENHTLTIQNHISEKLVMNPAYDINTMAQELNIPADRIQNAITALERQKNITHWRPQVDRLIRSRPGIEDDGLTEALGIDVLTIHLCVRPMLLNGSIHPGGMR